MNQFISKCFFSLNLVLSITGSACSLESTQPQSTTSAIKKQSEKELNIINSVVKSPTEITQTKIKNVEGTYEYEKEGYFNVFEIEQTKNRLKVSVHNYRTNGAETIDVAKARGTGRLKGNTANLELIDENHVGCRATIDFSTVNDSATIEVSETCRLNAMLNGVYGKVGGFDGVPEPSENPRMPQIPFPKLAGFVNDDRKHKAGKEYYITQVSSAKLQKKILADQTDPELQGLFYLEADYDGVGFGSELIVSQEMLDSLDVNADAKTLTLKMQAVLIEAKDNSAETRRLSYVIKIEGLDKSGRVLWTAESPKPKKISF